MQFATNLAQAMKQKKLSLSSLSRLSGISKTTLHGWLTGRKAKNVDQLKKIATILQTSIHQLLYGEPDPFEQRPQEVLEEIFYGDVRVTVHRIERRK